MHITFHLVVHDYAAGRAGFGSDLVHVDDAKRQERYRGAAKSPFSDAAAKTRSLFVIMTSSKTSDLNSKIVSWGPLKSGDRCLTWVHCH